MCKCACLEKNGTFQEGGPEKWLQKFHFLNKARVELGWTVRVIRGTFDSCRRFFVGRIVGTEKDGCIKNMAQSPFSGTGLNNIFWGGTAQVLGSPL